MSVCNIALQLGVGYDVLARRITVGAELDTVSFVMHRVVHYYYYYYYCYCYYYYYYY